MGGAPWIVAPLGPVPPRPPMEVVEGGSRAAGCPESTLFRMREPPYCFVARLPAALGELLRQDLVWKLLGSQLFT